MDKTKTAHIEKSFSDGERIIVRASLFYPYPEEKEKISLFYKSLAENLMLYAEKRADSIIKKGVSAPPVLIKLIPDERLYGDEYISYTLDVIISRGGETENYVRIAQSWDAKKEKLVYPRSVKLRKKGNGGFFIGKDGIYTVNNYFGREKRKRMSEYISEEKAIIGVKTKRKANNKTKI